jgi:hypothetical protein
VPRHANAGRRELFRAYMRSRLAVGAYLLGGGGAFLYGAYRREPLIMAGGIVAVATLVTVAAALLADRAAESRFFEALAPRLGLQYVGPAKLLALTPLLGAGDSQMCEHWMHGDISTEHGLAGGLGQFTYDVRWSRGTGTGRQEVTVERHTLTLCLIEIEPSTARFRGVFLRPRRGVFDGEDWLDGRGDRTLELESADFCRRYELRIADDQGELAVRELLSPSLVEWLARHPLVAGFELKAGTLVVFAARELDDAGTFELFLDGARRLAERVVDEVAEDAERVGAAAPRGSGGRA